LLLPVHQYKRDYQNMGHCHAECHVLCEQIVKELQANQRIFGHYYRVAFYGDLLKELDGLEYIYKESGAVRIGEMKTRLQKQFANKFGDEKVHMLSNIKDAKSQEMKPGHFYIQLVAVDPYFESDDLTKRSTLFEMHNNINKFIYETPFVKGAGDQPITDDLSQQWKKKTILTTELAFPYLRKRIAVVSKKEIELTPIENAIELIKQKSQNLVSEINMAQPNTKTLQQQLQGSLLIQVNQGPSAVVETFLGEKGKAYGGHTKILTDAFSEFLKLLARAVDLNKYLIGPEQLNLQTELEAAYFRMKQKFCSLTNTDPASIREFFSQDEGVVSPISSPHGSKVSPRRERDKN